MRHKRRIPGTDSELSVTVPVVVIYRGGHGAVAIARSLGRLGVPMYLVIQSGMATPVSSSRYWSECFTWDFDEPTAASLSFMNDLGRRLTERHGARPILMTLADWVAIFIEDHAPALADAFTFARSPTPTVRPLADKWQMYLLAKEHGIPVPESARPQTAADVETFLAVARFPIAMKSADPSMAFVPAMVIVEDRSALLAKFEQDLESGPANVILQEFIPGKVQDVWMCNAYFGEASACHAIFPGRKLRQVSATGIASLAVCQPNATVAEQTRAFMQAVGHQGCVGIGWRYDARDGSYKVLDVNPRVSGVFRLFTATNGLDVVRICYLDLTHQPIPRTALAVNRKWWLEDDIAAAIRAIREGRLTLGAWLRSLRGIDEAHWFATDDLRPFVAWLSRSTWQRVPRVLGRLRRRS